MIDPNSLGPYLLGMDFKKLLDEMIKRRKEGRPMTAEELSQVHQKSLEKITIPGIGQLLGEHGDWKGATTLTLEGKSYPAKLAFESNDEAGPERWQLDLWRTIQNEMDTLWPIAKSGITEYLRETGCDWESDDPLSSIEIMFHRLEDEDPEENWSLSVTFGDPDGIPYIANFLDRELVRTDAAY